MLWHKLLPIIVALSVVGCMTTRLSPYAPVEKKTDAPRERLYEAAEGTLLDRGFLIAERKPEVGTLKTEQRTMLGEEVFRSEYRYAFSIDTRGGKLRVEMSCSRGDKSSTEPCGTERPEKLVIEQARLVEAILAEATGERPPPEEDAGADAPSGDDAG